MRGRPIYAMRYPAGWRLVRIQGVHAAAGAPAAALRAVNDYASPFFLRPFSLWPREDAG
jgi:hypothetical protein